jgi:hypothetical protein
MREIWRISFTAGPRPFSVIERLLREAGLNALADGGRSSDSAYEAAFSSHDAAAALSSALDRAGLSWTMHHSREWDRSDLDSYPAAIPYLPVCGTGGASTPTEFDEDAACPVCGTGARPCPSAVVELPSVPVTPFRTEELVSMVPAQLAATFESVGATLAPAASVEGYTHDAMVISGLPLVGLDVERSDGLIVENQCVACRRDGHYWAAYEPVGPVTLERDVDSLAMSRQCFGKSARNQDGSIRNLAQPVLVMSTTFLQELFGRETNVGFVPAGR